MSSNRPTQSDLTFEHVSKRYFLRNPTDTERRRSWRLFRKSSEVWALRDVSFQVQRGEALGIVGHNGAGKSTILKLMSSITAPTAGEIAIRGRLSALVEVSSGFHPELTGRENIYLSGSIFGMPRPEITRKMESIIDFAGVLDFIDVPVKKYSSGMYVRLGFSIAAHLDPDILLLDEVLAVGDAAFQLKCLDRISQLREAGRTIVLVSHDLAALARLCDRALLLHQGRLVMTGSPRDVIDEYQSKVFAHQKAPATEPDTEKIAECAGIIFTSRESPDHIRTGCPMIAQFGYRATQNLKDVAFVLSVYWPSGYLCAQLNSSLTFPNLQVEPGEGMVEFYCPVLPIQPGLYAVDASIESNGHVIERRQRCAFLRVDPGKVVEGDFYIDHTCRLL